MNARIVASDRKFSPCDHAASAPYSGAELVETHPCWLFSVAVTNLGLAGAWLMIFDRDTIPLGAIPEDRPDVPAIYVPPNGTGYFDIGHAVPMENGIVIVKSTAGDFYLADPDPTFAMFVAWKRKG